VCSPSWHLVCGTRDRTKYWQLFDLAHDPWELDDLSARPEYAVRLGQLKKQLATQQEAFGDDRPPRHR
jgi:hypothetical protein